MTEESKQVERTATMNPLTDVNFRLSLVDLILKTIQDKTDPLFADPANAELVELRIKEFTQQRDNLLLRKKQIEAAMRGDVVVGLKTAVLFPKAGNENQGR